MDNEIVLSAKELYYLGKLMQARYIDYSYIAAMDDVGKNYSVFESESEKSLSDKGCIEEDFAFQGRSRRSSGKCRMLENVECRIGKWV